MGCVGGDNFSCPQTEGGTGPIAEVKVFLAVHLKIFTKYHSETDIASPFKPSATYI